MSDEPTLRCHVAIFANPEDAQALPALALVEELAGCTYQVTYVTSSEVASRFSLTGATEDSWDVVGCLDDTDEPVAVVLGYFADDVPDVVLHDSTAGAVARVCAQGWGLFTDTNRDGRYFDDQLGRLVAKFGFVPVPEQLCEPSASHLARH